MRLRIGIWRWVFEIEALKSNFSFDFWARFEVNIFFDLESMTIYIFFLLDVYTFWEDCSIYTFRQNVSRWWFKHCFFQPKPWVNGPICLSNRCCGWTSEPFSWPRSFVHVGNYDTKMVGKNIASNFRVNQGTVGCTPDRVQWTHYIIFIYIYVYL